MTDLREAVEKAQADEQEVQNAPEISEVEEQALSHGWRPKDEWEGDPEEWVSAKEFMKRGEYLGRITSQSRRIKELEKELRAVAVARIQDFENGRKSAIRELKTERKRAIEEEDLERVSLLDAQIEQEEEKFEEESAKVRAETHEKLEALREPEIPPEVRAWGEQNKWYENQPAMRVVMDAAIKDLVLRAPDMSPFDRILAATEIVKKEFPHRFEKKEASRKSSDVAPATRGSAKPGGSKSNEAFKRSLPPEAVTIMQRAVDQGYITEEEWIREYRKQTGE